MTTSPGLPVSSYTSTGVPLASPTRPTWPLEPDASTSQAIDARESCLEHDAELASMFVTGEVGRSPDRQPG